MKIWKPSFLWYGLGAIFYVLPSIGYIVFDIFAFLNITLSDTSWAIAYTTLACVFLLDAIFYFIGMAVYDPPVRMNRVTCTAGLWAEIMYISSAGVYVVSAALLFPLETLTFRGRTIFFFIAQSALNFAAVCGYVICAFLYNSRYHESRIEAGVPKWQGLWTDLYFWGEVFNTGERTKTCLKFISPHSFLLKVPSLGYLGTALYQIFGPLSFVFDMTTQQLITALRDVMFTMRSINVVFDFLYLIDALIYFAAWIRDERNAVLEGTDEEKDEINTTSTDVFETEESKAKKDDEIFKQWEAGLVELDKK